MSAFFVPEIVIFSSLCPLLAEWSCCFASKIQNNSIMDKLKSYYQVHATFWKEPLNATNYLAEKRAKLCRIDKTFSDSDTHTSQQEAFGYYQSLIDVLYEALGGHYTNDRQAQIDLQAFFNARCQSAVTRIGRMTFDDNLFNEIAVYQVVGGKKRLVRGIHYEPEYENA